ncbi:MAG: hypothetical protein WBQ83_14320 [Candidatus Acidiferrales bacterium]
MNPFEDVRAPRPEIIENYKDFEPPPQVKEIISILLDCVSPNYVDNILKGMPGWILKVPMARYPGFGEVLYHEIGHHIHAVHEPVHEGKENVAEDWSKRLGRQFFRAHYWYLVPFRYPILFLVKAGLRITGVLRRRRWDKTESNEPAT